MLLDVQMPEMDGFEAATHIRATEAGREVPILFLTAIHRDEDYARRGYASGAADYITKPFDADILRARVKAFVDLFHQREELRQRDVDLRTRERDEATRRLVGFEQIASAALGAGDLSALLRKLLGVFLEAADGADSATIFLREGDLLRVRASIGRSNDRAGRTLPIGRGLAGVVAATGEPFFSSEPGSSEYPGARSLFGVPLLHDGEVVGVIQIGSTTSDQFSEVEKRLLGALAERVAWAVAQRFRFDRFHEVLMSAPAIVSIVRGPNFACQFSNLAHRHLFGDRDVVGRPASELGATPEVVAMFEHVQATGLPATSREHPMFIDPRANGHRERRFFDFTVQPMRGQVGKVDELLWFAIDVTDQVLARETAEKASRDRAKLLESERAARAEAEVANRAKDDFLATVSHELRTPLNAILGWTVVARRQAPTELDRALGIIERNARAQTRIIEDVLDVSRIVGGKLRLDIAAADVAAAIEGALETVRPEAEAKGVVLSSDVGSVGIIAADADRLQQVVWNVLSNAIKFTPEGGTVDLAAARLGPRIVIRVADSGEGIEASFLPHLFEPFRQADGSTTRRHGGLGLGLAIVKQLVQAHGGTIRAESDGAKKGSTFTIEFPARSLPAVAPRLSANGEPQRLAADTRLDRVKNPGGRRRGRRALPPRRDPLEVGGHRGVRLLCARRRRGLRAIPARRPRVGRGHARDRRLRVHRAGASPSAREGRAHPGHRAHGLRARAGPAARGGGRLRAARRQTGRPGGARFRGREPGEPRRGARAARGRDRPSRVKRAKVLCRDRWQPSAARSGGSFGALPERGSDAALRAR